MKIWFAEEKLPYTVQARNERFLVCTKPFNLKHTVLYTIVDLKYEIRGTEDLIFCMGYETKNRCEEALKRLDSGESGLSRNSIKLNIVSTA